jgi:DNA-binding MarR family transcriptional regulator
MTEPVDLTAVDVATLAMLAGDAASRTVLTMMAAEVGVGVRASHGYVFQLLVDAEPTIGELASALGITQQGASKHVVELERLGYAERIPDPLDARTRRVRMSARGRAVLAAGRKARAELESWLVAAHGEADVATARRVLVGLLELTGEAGRVAVREAPLPE